MNNHFEDICRTCVTKQKNLYSLFSESFHPTNTKFIQMLESISIEVTPDDNLPKHICEECSKMLCAAYNFKEQCEQANKQLNDYLERKALEENEDNNENLFDNIDNIDEADDSFSMLLFKIETISNSDTEEQTASNDLEAFLINENSHGVSSETNISCLGENSKTITNSPASTAVKSTIQSDQFTRPSFRKPKKFFACKLCDSTFQSRYGLQYHMKCHRGIKKYACPYENCEKSFRDKCSLRKHQAIHTNERKHLCNFCGKTFNLVDSLNYHLKSHGLGRSYICSFCKRSFKQACHLRIHMWIHTGIKPYLCSTCGRSYTSSGQFKKHTLKYCGVKKAPQKRGRRKKIIPDSTTNNQLHLVENEMKLLGS